VVVVVVVVVVVGSGSGSGSIIKFTGKHDKNHETDNETHTCITNIYPYVPKCIEPCSSSSGSSSGCYSCGGSSSSGGSGSPCTVNIIFWFTQDLLFTGFNDEKLGLCSLSFYQLCNWSVYYYIFDSLGVGTTILPRRAASDSFLSSSTMGLIRRSNTR
jgi:hypothetical protein